MVLRTKTSPVTFSPGRWFGYSALRVPSVSRAQSSVLEARGRRQLHV